MLCRHNRHKGTPKPGLAKTLESEGEGFRRLVLRGLSLLPLAEAAGQALLWELPISCV